MPPHLHPRSTATSTLFAGTLLASFVVVGIPHVFPCPRPRTGYAADSGQLQFDEDGKAVPVRARRRKGEIMARREDGDEGEHGAGMKRMYRGGEEGQTPSTTISKLQPRPSKSTAPATTAPQPPSTKGTNIPNLDEESALFASLAAEAAILEQKAKLARECPVPKPTGWVGRMLGFEDRNRREPQQRRSSREGQMEKG